MTLLFLTLMFLIIIVPVLRLDELSDEELDGYVQDKIDALTGNPNFLITDPTVAAVQLALTDYRLKLAASKDGTKADTQAKNEARKGLEELITLLANDVARRSSGDIVKYLTSHFDYKKPGVQAPPLDVPKSFLLSFTKYEKQLKASCKKVTHASSYEFRLTKDKAKPEEEWEIKMISTAAKVIFTNLESGIRYYGVVRAIGSKGKLSDWSDPSDKICP